MLPNNITMVPRSYRPLERLILAEHKNHRLKLPLHVSAAIQRMVETQPPLSDIRIRILSSRLTPEKN